MMNDKKLKKSWEETFGQITEPRIRKDLKEGFSSFSMAVNALKGLAQYTSLDIAMVPVNTMLEQFKLGTMNESVELMIEMQKLMEDENFKTGVSVLLDLTNQFISENLTGSVQEFNSLLDNLSVFGGSETSKNIKGFADSMVTLDENLAIVNTTLSALKETLDGFQGLTFTGMLELFKEGVEKVFTDLASHIELSVLVAIRDALANFNIELKFLNDAIDKLSESTAELTTQVNTGTGSRINETNIEERLGDFDPDAFGRQ